MKFISKALKLELVRVFLLVFFVFGCATNSKSRWAAMGLAMPIGAGVGLATTPVNEKPEFHALTWGSAFIAATALFGNYYFNDDEELKKLRLENTTLKSKSEFQLITEGKGFFKTPFEKKRTKKVKWKVYKMDKWISDGENRKFHQDMMIEKINTKN